MSYTVSWSNRFEIKQDRWVYNPTIECRKQGRLIIKELNKQWTKPVYYYHLRDGGHVAALNNHIKSNYFATLDLSNFFGSISRSRITRALKTIIGYDDARKVAKLSTVKSPENYQYSHYLPYGFVQSPLLASICLFDSSLGKLLDTIYKKNTEVNVSVYMDDIVISSKNKTKLSRVYEEIKLAAYKSKFDLNDNKTCPVSTQTKAFNIIISTGEMSIENKRFQKFKEIYSTSQSLPQKHGIGGYVGSVNKQQARLLDEVNN
ncbi:hypothetical protein C9J19_05940 [Photobacterium phosphoreum]|uniref:reverse transcriptase domain-containing protein n=1 Tax=Photobacterium phosphoreum TaxID=659 RepID=UPI000D15B781|nr:reverse transcriptase domain-containing protein [Photobacterium phosphoreum]PSW29617.1 hypothetical protein C9J19_05940 [Photobacterium phosphoreum]